MYSISENLFLIRMYAAKRRLAAIAGISVRLLVLQEGRMEIKAAMQMREMPGIA